MMFLDSTEVVYMNNFEGFNLTQFSIKRHFFFQKFFFENFEILQRMLRFYRSKKQILLIILIEKNYFLM